MHIRPKGELQRAVDAIDEHGCPICGEAAVIRSVIYIDAFDLGPCEHLVVPQDAIEMERFYEQLRTAEIEGNR